MQETLKIQVYTDSSPAAAGAPPAKAAVTDASVALIPRSEVGTSEWPHDDLAKTHSHQSDGWYTPDSGESPLPGEYLLVVRKDSMSPVVQRITLFTQRSVLRARAGWQPDTGLAHQAATVSIVNVGQRVSPNGDVAQTAVVSTLLLPISHFVGVGCHNHKNDGTRYVLMARGRRNYLYGKKILDRGTIATIFDQDARKKQLTVKSAAPARGSWVVVYEEEKAPLADDAGKARPFETSEHEYGILDYYDHIDQIGWTTPGTLIEAGVFGHGWVQGPIVWGTSDFSPSGTERFQGAPPDPVTGQGQLPMDLDGRQKDFVARGSMTEVGTASGPVVMDRFPELAQAFKKGTGAFRVWGCVHMFNVIAQTRTAWLEIQKGTPRDRFFEIVWDLGGRENATLDFVKANVAQFIVARRSGRPQEHGDCRGIAAYGGMAARHLSSIPTWVAPPGMGSNYGVRDGEPTFLVSTGGENALPFRWWRHEFPDHFVEDDLHYANYVKMLSAALPDPGWRTQRYVLFHDDDQMCAVLRVAGGFELFIVSEDPNRRLQQVPRGVARRPVEHVFSGTPGHLYVLGNVVRLHIQVRGPNRVMGVRMAGASNPARRDAALFVDVTGRTWYLEAAPGGAPADFAPPATPLEVWQAEHVGRNQWRKQTRLADITDGVVQQVPPVWYW